MSDTPRTDALEKETRRMAGPTLLLERERVVWELCRQLEREKSPYPIGPLGLPQSAPVTQVPPTTVPGYCPRCFRLRCVPGVAYGIGPGAICTCA